MNSGTHPTLVESAFRGHRWPAVVLAVIVPALCLGWIAAMGLDMYGPMSGASAWMMTPTWDAAHLVLLWAMWAAMMLGMMLPSAVPLLLLYGSAARSHHERSVAAARIYLLAAGYATAWISFSVGATLLQRQLSSWLIVSPMMEFTTPLAGAVVLLVGGLYQLSPLKAACLRVCRTPLGFLMRRWRPGAAGAFRMGAEHGAYCVGCCWALMLLLFVGGVMNVAVIAALTTFVALEKLGPFGARGARVSGGLLIAAAVWMLARSS